MVRVRGSVPAVGATIALGASIEAPMFLPAGYGYDRLGRKAVAVPSLGLLAFGWSILSKVSSRRGMVVAAALIGKYGLSVHMYVIGHVENMHD